MGIHGIALVHDAARPCLAADDLARDLPRLADRDALGVGGDDLADGGAEQPDPGVVEAVDLARASGSAGALGYALQRWVLNGTLGKDPLPSLVVTFGLSIVIQNALLETFSADPRSLDSGALATSSVALPGGLSVGVLPLVILAVLAIGAGIADGLGFGANARAALITRGLAEVQRLGLALGARRDTFLGLSGLGDLLLTCTDNQSRNRRVGLALAEGKTPQQAVEALGQVAEGVVTARAVRQLAERLAVNMPLCGEVYRVLYERRDPHAAVQALLAREPSAEL